jgi:hypothetical protein
MWRAGEIRTRELWFFAYDDAGGSCLPRASEQASLRKTLSDPTWEQKRQVLLDSYGFAIDSWEVRITPRIEGFFCFTRPDHAKRHIGVVEVAR